MMQQIRSCFQQLSNGKPTIRAHLLRELLAKVMPEAGHGLLVSKSLGGICSRRGPQGGSQADSI